MLIKIGNAVVNCNDVSFAYSKDKTKIIVQFREPSTPALHVDTKDADADLETLERATIPR